MRRWFYGLFNGPEWQPAFFMLAAALMLSGGLVSAVASLTAWGWLIAAIGALNLFLGWVWLQRVTASRVTDWDRRRLRTMEQTACDRFSKRVGVLLHPLGSFRYARSRCSTTRRVALLDHPTQAQPSSCSCSSSMP
jgi:hypothetical protein